ncbi:MAG: UbiX family flavin prenyltransferase [Dehalococcoidales bacterium]|nr:UbiX family flavin prenyltransferase [Dehalococcoidales bacterium]
MLNENGQRRAYYVFYLRGGCRVILIIGITGASGAIYGIRLLEVLSSNKEVETHLIISEVGEEIIRHETDWGLEQVRALADVCYDINDIGARLSSGSFKRDGMVIAPCSMKTLSALANSYTDNLITRAADIALKERKRLVLLARETPLHLGHLRNMVKLTEMGAIVFPPIPAFYHKPETIRDLVDHTVGKVLDVFDIKHDLFKRWEGLNSEDK